MMKAAILIATLLLLSLTSIAFGSPFHHDPNEEARKIEKREYVPDVCENVRDCSEGKECVNSLCIVRLNILETEDAQKAAADKASAEEAAAEKAAAMALLGVNCGVKAGTKTTCSQCCEAKSAGSACTADVCEGDCFYDELYMDCKSQPTGGDDHDHHDHDHDDHDHDDHDHDDHDHHHHHDDHHDHDNVDCDAIAMPMPCSDASQCKWNNAESYCEWGDDDHDHDAHHGHDHHHDDHDQNDGEVDGCALSTMARCYGIFNPDGSKAQSDKLIEDVAAVKDAQTCQKFCKVLYPGICTWFLFDKKSHDCRLYKGSVEDLHKDCHENSYAVHPKYTECIEVFDETSSNACLNFREDYCRNEFSLLENLDNVQTLAKCQTACELVTNCTHFVYDKPSKTCKLEWATFENRNCDIIHGTALPSLQDCVDDKKLPWWGKQDISKNDFAGNWIGYSSWDPAEKNNELTLEMSPISDTESEVWVVHEGSRTRMKEREAIIINGSTVTFKGTQTSGEYEDGVLKFPDNVFGPGKYRFSKQGDDEHDHDDHDHNDHDHDDHDHDEHDHDDHDHHDHGNVSCGEPNGPDGPKQGVNGCSECCTDPHPGMCSEYQCNGDCELVFSGAESTCTAKGADEYEGPEMNNPYHGMPQPGVSCGEAGGEERRADECALCGDGDLCAGDCIFDYAEEICVDKVTTSL